MRYHYNKPQIYLSMYGQLYICNHPVYDSCTLYKIDEKGLAVIQQRYDVETKSTWIRDWIQQYMVETTCPKCKGSRLDSSVLSVLVNKKNKVKKRYD